MTEPQNQLAPQLNVNRNRPGNSGFLIVRSILWIVISSIFLVWNVHRILQLRALHLPTAWWAYMQVVVWMIALGFWLRAGWRDFERRDAGQS